MKNFILIVTLILASTSLSACTLKDKNLSLGKTSKVDYGEQVQERIETGEYQYRDENQVAEEMELLMPTADSTDIEDIESELETLKILEEDFSDL